MDFALSDGRQAIPDRVKASGADRSAEQCLQLHGGCGFPADHGTGKTIRDLRLTVARKMVGR